VVSLERRFFSKIKKTDDGCWLWQGGVQRQVSAPPQPYFYVRRVKKSARQVAALLMGQDVPEGYVLKVVCGSPLCVNPSHMAVVPRGDVFGHGETHTRAKLTVAEVDDIRRLLLFTNLTHQEVAEMVGVSRTTITLINLGINWSEQLTIERK